MRLEGGNEMWKNCGYERVFADVCAGRHAGVYGEGGNAAKLVRETMCL